jgi:hypothetical protein
MTAAQLIAVVEAAIGSLSAIYKGSADESDLYEAALLTIAVKAARLAGGAEFLTNDGLNPAPTITFRRGPGNLWTPGFTRAGVSFVGSAKRLEVHLGVKVAGASGVAHECDVSLIEGAECERSRAGGVHPRRSKVVGAIEAKHYVVSPGLDIGRGFLGLGTELGGSRCSLAFPAAASANLETLIARKDPECFPEVVPSASAAERLCRHLEQLIRNWLA